MGVADGLGGELFWGPVDCSAGLEPCGGEVEEEGLQLGAGDAGQVWIGGLQVFGEAAEIAGIVAEGVGGAAGDGFGE